ncbi:hypothetical protein [Rubrobacter xylanophilus]|uniref:hypothetical protein n=1 Tax=Rubrobacter xylanophilus TaxID=49319 RepID=UPI0000460CE3|nr:hypothetical protein [Rubrobacter xylanophilus]
MGTRRTPPAARTACALAFAAELLLLWALPDEFAARPLSGSLVSPRASSSGPAGGRCASG